MENPCTVFGWLYKCFPRKFCQSRSSAFPDQQLNPFIFIGVMNTDPPPVIDPGERGELDEVFHRPVNETEPPEQPEHPTPPIPEEPAAPGPEQPDLPEPDQPDVPPPVPLEPPVHPEAPELPVTPEVPRPEPPHRPENPRPEPPRHPKEPVRPEQPPRPDQPGGPPRPDHPGPPWRPEDPRDPRPPRHPEPPHDPEPPRDPAPPRDPERPQNPGPPRPPEPPHDPEGPLDPEPPRGPEHPRLPCFPADCLPTGCVLSEAAFLAGLAGAMAAFTACLAVVGLYVVIRYFSPYLFTAALIFFLVAIVYIFIRRPEDARRFRQFLAERGREAVDRLWGWATRRPEVCTF